MGEGMTTPYEREILTHYFTRAAPWKDGSENWKPLDHEIIDRFITLGLLIQIHSPETKIEANHDALRVYFEALAAVPLPVQRWVTP